MTSSAEGAECTPDALALIARAADGSVRDGLSLLDQAIAQGGAEAGGGPIGAERVADMLGLADRGRVFDLLEAVLSGQPDQAGRSPDQTLRASIMRSMMGCRMISIAIPILPPGTTIELRRDMNESWIMDSR